MKIHAPHAHDARRPYPPIRSRSGRSPRARGPARVPAVRGGQGRRGADLGAVARDLLVLLAVMTAALVVLTVASAVVRS